MAHITASSTAASRSWWLLLGDFSFFLALFVVAVVFGHGRHRVLGSGIAIPAFILWFTAKLQLGTSFSFRPEARHLVACGIYSRIQHPIYFFSTLVLLGTALCLGSPYFYAYVGITVVIQLWRIRQETSVLQRKFGEQYLAYQRRTWF